MSHKIKIILNNFSKYVKILMVNIMNKLILKWIKFYQTRISINTKPKCRYIPTCSEYAKICYKRFSFFKASYLTINRLLRCNPLFKMKVDNPPKKIIRIKNTKIKNLR